MKELVLRFSSLSTNRRAVVTKAAPLRASVSLSGARVVTGPRPATAPARAVAAQVFARGAGGPRRGGRQDEENDGMEERLVQVCVFCSRAVFLQTRTLCPRTFKRGHILIARLT